MIRFFRFLGLAMAINCFGYAGQWQYALKAAGDWPYGSGAWWAWFVAGCVGVFMHAEASRHE